MKTTPTPWHYQEDSDAYTHIIRGPKNQFVASGPQDSSGRSEADLRFIVQCVNSERPADPAGETKDATLKLSSGLFVQYEEYAKLEAQLAASQAECEKLTKTLVQIRSGVLLMVPEPQKSGFLGIIDPVLSTPPDAVRDALREALLNVVLGNDLALERNHDISNWRDSDFRKQALKALSLAESAGKGE